MNRLATFSLLPMVGGLLVALVGLSHAVSESSSAWQWCVLLIAALVVTFLVAALLNLAVFAPVYWLLGRRQIRERSDYDKET